MHFELILQLTSIIHHGFFSVALCFFHALVLYRLYITEYWFTVAIYRKLFSNFSWRMLNWNFPLFSSSTHFSKHPRHSLDSQLFFIFLISHFFILVFHSSFFGHFYLFPVKIVTRTIISISITKQQEILRIIHIR